MVLPSGLGCGPDGSLERWSSGRVGSAARGGAARSSWAAPVAVDLAAQERGGVHQAERGVGQHPGLGGASSSGRRPVSTVDPLFDVEALQPADLPARLLRQPVELVQVQRDDGRVLQRELDVELDQTIRARSRAAVPARPAPGRRPAAPR